MVNLVSVEFISHNGGVGRSAMARYVTSPVQSQNIVSSAANQVTTLGAPTGAGKRYARVATDTAIWVAVGAAPNALTQTTSRVMLPAGEVEYFLCNVADKVAVVNAS